MTTDLTPEDVAREARAARIRELNDALRTQGRGNGTIAMTRGVIDHGATFVQRAHAAVVAFDDFTDENDPYHEHDFGSFEIDHVRLFFKVDYYDRTREYGSPDPADERVTHRVLTILLAEEY